MEDYLSNWERERWEEAEYLKEQNALMRKILGFPRQIEDELTDEFREAKLEGRGD